VSNVTPTFSGEVQFRRYSDTSTQGQQVVFAVQDREALESFVGMEGKRFMAVLVQIGDDDQPVQGDEKTAGGPQNSRTIDKPQAKREYLGDLCYRAVQWCNDPEFQRWVRERTGTSAPVDADMAKQFILMKCGVESRKELDTEAEAAEKFRRTVMAPWNKYLIARRSA